MTQLEQNTLGTSGKERPGAAWGQGQERRRWVGKKLTPDEELGARPLHLVPLPQTLWSQLASPGPGPVDSQLCSCLSHPLEEVSSYLAILCGIPVFLQPKRVDKKKKNFVTSIQCK